MGFSTMPGSGDLVALEDQAAFAAILDILNERCGADFRRYRLATVRRRVLNRMISVRARTFQDYLRLLSASADEPDHLLSRVTIKVSRFYRNKVTFDALRRDVLPALLAAQSHSQLRILCAGCGEGEEPYTLAMLLEEARAPGTIEAIDLDPRALAAAAVGRYEQAALAELPADFIERYLEPTGNEFSVRESIRRRVTFNRRDIAAWRQPDSRELYDLLCCRNVLIYFEREVQERILGALCRSVRPGGFLCLGEAEWPMPPIAMMLQPLPHKTRLFRVNSAIRHVQ